MTDQHPITPTKELVNKWESEWHHYRGRDTYEVFMTKRAARWGAGQELDACVEWISKQDWTWTKAQLLAARRPKPLSEADLALNDLKQLLDAVKPSGVFNPPDNIRRCLERLKKLEESTND